MQQTFRAQKMEKLKLTSSVTLEELDALVFGASVSPFTNCCHPLERLSVVPLVEGCLRSRLMPV